MPYRYKLEHPNSSNNITPLKSQGFQTPFFFGGAQVPTGLMLNENQYSGSKGSGLKHHYNIHNAKGKGFKKDTISLTHPGDLDFTTKKGDKVYHRKGHNVKLPHSLPFAI